MANLGFSTPPCLKKLTLGDCDKDRQPKMAQANLAILFLVVDRCRNHLANLLTSSLSSKIPNLALFDAICYSSRDVIISSIGGHIDMVLRLPTLHTYKVHM